MGKKIETLSEYQESQIIPHRNWWLNYILSCKNEIQKEKAKKQIKWLYKYCGKKEPVIIFMDSPFGCQVAANFFKNCLNRDNIGDNIRDNIWDNIRANIGDNIRANIGDNIGDNIRDNIWDNIRANIGDNIRANIGDNIRDNIWDNIRANIRANIGDNIRDNIRANIGDNIRDNIWDNIRANIRDNIRANIRDNKLEYFPTSYYGNISDYGWVAWIDFFLKLNLIKTYKKDDFENFKELLLSGVFEMVQLDGICFVSNMPVKIFRNDSGRLHNPAGYAVEFKDDYGQNYINGRFIPVDVFEKTKNITKEEFISERNSDYKGAWYEILGQKGIMKLLGATEVDSKQIVHRNGEKETVTLLKTKEVFEEIDNQPFAWVKMECPSTGTQYLQGVEPHHTCAIEAIASLSMFKKEEYQFDLRS